MEIDITTLFCFIDDFCKEIDKNESKQTKTRIPGIQISEIILIILLFNHSMIKNFKHFYLTYLPIIGKYFKFLPSYTRFIELKPRALEYLIIILQYYCSLSKKKGNFYIDSTSLKVCSNKRTYSHKVFSEVAKLGKSSMGWFFGLKLHLIIDENGNIANFVFTPGNVDDRTPVEDLTRHLRGLIFGDKGYISEDVFSKLFERGLKLVTGIKKNMKNKLMTVDEKIRLRKRSIIESVFNVLKNYFDLENSRHRSVENAMVHSLSILISYGMHGGKPAIKMN